MIEKEPSGANPVSLGAESDRTVKPAGGVVNHSESYRSHIIRIREYCSLRFGAPEHAPQAMVEIYGEIAQQWGYLVDRCLRPLIGADRADVIELDYEFREDGSSDPSFLGGRSRPAILLGHCVVEELLEPLISELVLWHQQLRDHLEHVMADQEALSAISKLYGEYRSALKAQSDPPAHGHFLWLCGRSGLLSLDKLSIEETGINLKVIVPDNGFNRSGVVLLEGNIGYSVIFSSDTMVLSQVVAAERREYDVDMLKSLGFPSSIAQYGIDQVEDSLTSIERYQSMIALWSNLYPDRPRVMPSHEQQIDHLVQAGLPIDLFKANLEIDISSSYLQGEPVSLEVLTLLRKALGVSAFQQAPVSSQIDFEALEQLFRLDHDLWGVSLVKSSDVFGFGYVLKLENNTGREEHEGSDPIPSISKGYEFTFNIEYESAFEPRVTDVELLVYNSAAPDQDVRSYRGFEARIVYQILRYNLGYTWPSSNAAKGVVDSEYE